MTRRAASASAAGGLRGARRRIGAALAIACSAVLLLTGATPAWAAYKTTIEAPRSIRKLLSEHLDLARFAGRDDITDEQFDFLVTAAPRQARDLLATQGYFSPVVQTDLRTRDGKKSVVVSVTPGPLTHVSSVQLNFSGPVLAEAPDRESATRAAWTLQPGAAFSQDGWDEAKNAALKALQAERYLGAKVLTSRATVDPQTHLAALAVTFDSGPTFRMGALAVSGLKRYPEAIVRNVNPLYVGEIYSATQVQELQRQVQSTAYFASVAVDVVNDRNHPDGAPVQVKVNEYPFQSVRTGVGYSTDTGADAEASYGYNNMFGRAWVFTAQGRIDQDSRFGSLQLAMPPDGKAYVNSVTASYTNTDVQNVNIYSFRVGVQRARTLQFYDYAYSLMYYHDRLDQNVGPSQTSHALVPGWAWGRRDVDDPVFPRKGNLVAVEAGFAVKGLLTDQTFARAYAHGRQYFPIGPRDIVLLHAELGGVFSSGPSSGIPASLLFRAGGSGSVRGYSYQSIGNNVAGSVLPTKYMATAGAEYQHWVNRDWGGAVFYDIGTATDTWSERTFESGVGVGVRWRSPVGPVNADVAYGLRNHSIRPYLTLGIAF